MKKSERKNHINYWRQSGQTKKAYSELAGIKYATFISWFKKSEEEQIGRFVKLEKIKQSSGEAAATTQQVEETEEAVEWLPHRIGPEILEKFEAEVKGG
ncbi:MAG: hypothetical protein ACI8YQ_003342 [Polaribacter sp.]|jgi:hypothetical protein